MPYADPVTRIRHGANLMATAKRLLKLLLAFLFLACAISMLSLYALASVKGYDTISLPPTGLDRTRPNSQYENVSFPSRGQAYRVYAFYLPGNSGYPALILAHGYKGTRYSEIGRAEDLQALGYTVLSIDLSDNGGDTVGNGRISMGYSERWDVLGAYDYLLTRGFRADRIGLEGISMGAATVILAAAAEPRIRAIWADSAYTRADVEISEQAQADGIPSFIVPGGLLAGMLISGDRVWEAAPIDAASTLAQHNQAVYLIHCRNDHA